MHHRTPIGVATIAIALGVTIGTALAFDETRYPNWKGQWLRTETGTPRYDPTKPMGRPQQAPLKPEYQAFLREGGPVEQIRPGDVIWFAAGEKHCHGAAPTTAMTHIAIAEALDGKVVDWMEHVSDAQYRA